MCDLHVAHPENRRTVDGLRPRSDGDRLLVAGDVGERSDGVARALCTLKDRFPTVVRSPATRKGLSVRTSSSKCR